MKFLTYVNHKLKIKLKELNEIECYTRRLARIVTLCIETESNRDPCEPGNSSTTGRNSTSQQPEPGSWSDIFQQIGNRH